MGHFSIFCLFLRVAGIKTETHVVGFDILLDSVCLRVYSMQTHTC